MVKSTLVEVLACKVCFLLIYSGKQIYEMNSSRGLLNDNVL